MDLGYLIKTVCSLITYIFSLRFSVFGYEITVGSMLVYACIVGLVLSIIRRLSE